MGGKNGDITITDVMNRPLLIHSDTIGVRHSKERYEMGNILFDMLASPDEVFSFHKILRKGNKDLPTYSYIKFYRGNPVVVIVQPERENLRVKTIYESTVNQIGGDRKVVLHYIGKH